MCKTEDSRHCRKKNGSDAVNWLFRGSLHFLWFDPCSNINACLWGFWEQSNAATINIRKWHFLTKIIASIRWDSWEGNKERRKRETAVYQWKGSGSDYSLSLQGSENKILYVAQSSFHPGPEQDNHSSWEALEGQKHIVHHSWVSMFNPLSSSWATTSMFRRTDRNRVSESWLVSRLT